MKYKMNVTLHSVCFLKRSHTYKRVSVNFMGDGNVNCVTNFVILYIYPSQQSDIAKNW